MKTSNVKVSKWYDGDYPYKKRYPPARRVKMLGKLVKKPKH